MGPALAIRRDPQPAPAAPEQTLARAATLLGLAAILRYLF